MLLTKKNGPEHLQNWSCARLGVLSRLVLGNPTTKCEVSGLSFGKQDGKYGIPVPDMVAGQGLHLEILRQGVLALVNGKELKWDDRNIVYDNEILITASTGILGTVFPILRLFSGLSRLVHWEGNSFMEYQQTPVVSVLNKMLPITSLAVTDNVKLVEILDRREDIEDSYIVPMRDTCVVSKMEFDRLKYASGRTPTVGVFDDIRVDEAPSALMAVNVKMPKETHTLKFMHIVGTSDIGFESKGIAGSFEQVTLLLHDSYALVFLGASRTVAGKFRYTVGSNMELLNVFNVRYFEGDVTMSHGHRYYMNTSSTDVGLDVLSYMTDRRYDYASGRDYNGSVSGLTTSGVTRVLAAIPEGCKVYGCKIDRVIQQAPTPEGMYRFVTDKGSYTIQNAIGYLKIVRPDGKYMNEVLRLVARYVSFTYALTLLFADDDLYLTYNKKTLVLKNVGRLVEPPVILPATNDTTIKRIIVFAASDYVLPASDLFADAVDGEGFVGVYKRGNSKVGAARVHLPSHSYQVEDAHELVQTAVGAKFSGYLLECHGDDAIPVVRSEVTAKYQGYFLEHNHNDAEPVLRSEVTAKYQGYLLEQRPSDAPYAPTPELRADGIYVHAVMDADNDPNLVQDFTVPEFRADGVYIHAVMDADDDPDLEQDFTVPELNVDGIFMYVVES